MVGGRHRTEGGRHSDRGRETGKGMVGGWHRTEGGWEAGIGQRESGRLA